LGITISWPHWGEGISIRKYHLRENVKREEILNKGLKKKDENCQWKVKGK
jgi:hypothetical protein